MGSDSERREAAPGFEDIDDLSLEAFRAFRDAMRANGGALAKRFAAKGAHMGQAACLRALDGREGLTQREMAEILQVSPPSITAMLQAVEKAGLVVRRTDENDQRALRVYLTDEGREVGAELREVLARYVEGTFGALPVEDRLELIRLLRAVRDSIERAATKTETDEEEADRT